MSENNLETMRHSLAHIMASAVQKLWPNAKFGVGPVVENGFYYDIDLGEVTISEDDFLKIEEEMQKIIKEDQKFEKSEQPVDAGIAWAKKANQPYKEELLNDLKREGTTLASELDASLMGLPAGISGATPAKASVGEVTFYKNGGFIDLCRGPHVESTGKVGAFKLVKVAGAYWRGNEKNPQMQRLYGVAFQTEKELQHYLHMVEEAKKRDHRKIGKEMDLFVFSDLVGAGLPLFTPKGTTVRNELDNYVQEMRDEYDYHEVTTPHINRRELFEKSGHWDKFANELFKIKTRERHEFAMKPMSCPMHTQIYASVPRSYKDLPIRYRESAVVYRDEQSGELSGLSRVRSFTQDDAHVFCRENQIKAEFLKIWDIVNRFYGALDFPLYLRFSRHDPLEIKNYSGQEKDWISAEKQIKELIEDQIGQDYVDGLGEAAFYGPKLDFMSKDALGREWQVATIQLDFNQPEGFDLTCVDESGNQERIFMIHAAIMGSIDRFLSVLIEHTSGKFPIWLAPEQIRVVTVNQEIETTDFAQKILDQAKELRIRLSVDNDNESVGKKIRRAEQDKVPYTLVIGEKEVAGGRITPRIRKDLVVISAHPELAVEDFLKTVRNEVKSRVSKTSL